MSRRHDDGRFVAHLNDRDLLELTLDLLAGVPNPLKVTGAQFDWIVESKTNAEACRA